MTPIACAASKAWKARNVRLRSTCASAVAASRRRLRRNTGIDCARPGPTSSRASTGSSCDAATPITAIVQNQRAPGQHGPPGDEQRQQRRRHEAAAQIVENLPAADERQRVALEAAPRRHERKQPEEDLPVAADPAVLPPRVRQHARRVVVDQLDVRHERDARVQPLEQIVGEQRVLRDRAFERRGEGVDVVEPLAGEDAFAEEILIGVGDRRRVGIDAGVPGIEPREQRTGGAHERDADARLQDAVALGDAAGLRVERRRG